MISYDELKPDLEKDRIVNNVDCTMAVFSSLCSKQSVFKDLRT